MAVFESNQSVQIQAAPADTLAPRTSVTGGGS
jgi:hypothetical protein